MVNGNLMTIEDLSDYLKVTRRTIYDWLKHNKIPALKLVGQWRFKKEKIDDWLDSQTQHQTPGAKRICAGVVQVDKED